MKAKKTEHRLGSYNPEVNVVRTVQSYGMADVSLRYWLTNEEALAWLEDVSFTDNIVSGGHNWAAPSQDDRLYRERYKDADTYKATA